ncbi:hypothetical protein [Undibacterium sp.]|jgi:hypothetical protein|uniref:hypothetical protein n=1 Tax=Undibacterium sp. TaxID=1914977 RepID=UPI002C07BD4B|nr:hypothetical protein [Undibacterium sp.]HTD02496.1 hypothetical protein [Undibacterium sp.]
MREFTIQSNLAVDAAQFAAATSMHSVNWELAPIVRMTAPAAWKDCSLDQWETGRLLFKSWIFLFGFIPVDLHAFRLQEIYPGVGFQERSWSWMNREWSHRRMVVAHGHGCTVTDQVAVVGRFPILSALLMPVYKFVFRHRHRRLQNKYGKSDRAMFS